MEFPQEVRQEKHQEAIRSRISNNKMSTRALRRSSPILFKQTFTDSDTPQTITVAAIHRLRPLLFVGSLSAPFEGILALGECYSDQ
jgi:hypothetical protein